MGEREVQGLTGESLVRRALEYVHFLFCPCARAAAERAGVAGAGDLECAELTAVLDGTGFVMDPWRFNTLYLAPTLAPMTILPLGPVLRHGNVAWVREQVAAAAAASPGGWGAVWPVLFAGAGLRALGTVRYADEYLPCAHAGAAAARVEIAGLLVGLAERLFWQHAAWALAREVLWRVSVSLPNADLSGISAKEARWEADAPVLRLFAGSSLLRNHVTIRRLGFGADETVPAGEFYERATHEARQLALICASRRARLPRLPVELWALVASEHLGVAGAAV